jgi:hypothetical protein
MLLCHLIWKGEGREAHGGERHPGTRVTCLYEGGPAGRVNVTEEAFTDPVVENALDAVALYVQGEKLLYGLVTVEVVSGMKAISINCTEIEKVDIPEGVFPSIWAFRWWLGGCPLIVELPK